MKTDWHESTPHSQDIYIGIELSFIQVLSIIEKSVSLTSSCIESWCVTCKESISSPNGTIQIVSKRPLLPDWLSRLRSCLSLLLQRLFTCLHAFGCRSCVFHDNLQTNWLFLSIKRTSTLKIKVLIDYSCFLIIDTPFYNGQSASFNYREIFCVMYVSLTALAR